VVNIEGKKVGVCHEPYLMDNFLDSDKLDYIFYGHTHKPWSEKRNSTFIFNPGTLGGVFQKATFAVWDTSSNKVELKLLEKI
jgi:predicted phosphodiesterase